MAYQNFRGAGISVGTHDSRGIGVRCARNDGAVSTVWHFRRLRPERDGRLLRNVHYRSTLLQEEESNDAADGQAPSWLSARQPVVCTSPPCTGSLRIGCGTQIRSGFELCKTPSVSLRHKVQASLRMSHTLGGSLGPVSRSGRVST